MYLSEFFWLMFSYVLWHTTGSSVVSVPRMACARTCGGKAALCVPILLLPAGLRYPAGRLSARASTRRGCSAQCLHGCAGPSAMLAPGVPRRAARAAAASCWRRCCTWLCPPRAGEAPSLAAKEAVYGLLTDLLAVGAPPAWLLPPPADPATVEPGLLPGLRLGPARDLPLHTSAPLDAARMATAMRVFLAAVCGDVVHCARGGGRRCAGPRARPHSWKPCRARGRAGGRRRRRRRPRGPDASQADPQPCLGRRRWRPGSVGRH